MKKLCITVIMIVLSINVKAPNHNSILFTLVKIEGKINRYIEQREKEEKRINTILETIRIIESGDNYFLKGGSGEYGAYQFTRTTWKRMCLIYYDTILDIRNPKNQDLIAYYKVKSLVKKGYTDQEIASIWNCGSNRWKNRVGVNRYGVKYNVPYYVSKFTKVKYSIESSKS